MKRKEPKFRYKNIMLLDDNELDNFINQKTMESVHFSEKIYVNTSAMSALEFLKNLANMGQHTINLYPEVIFVDLNMPVIDGFQFIETVQHLDIKELKDIKLVILTSSLHEGDRQRAAKLSDKILFLNKPLTKAMLDSI